jgi:hypothetical protein
MDDDDDLSADEQEALRADMDEERKAERTRLRPALVGYAMASLHRAFCPRCGNRLITEAERQP